MKKVLKNIEWKLILLQLATVLFASAFYSFILGYNILENMVVALAANCTGYVLFFGLLYFLQGWSDET